MGRHSWRSSMAASLALHILILSALGLAARKHIEKAPEMLIEVSLADGEKMGKTGKEGGGAAAPLPGSGPLAPTAAFHAEPSGAGREMQPFLPVDAAGAGSTEPAAAASDHEQGGETAVKEGTFSGTGPAGGGDSAGGGDGTAAGSGDGNAAGSGNGGTGSDSDESRPASLSYYRKQYPAASRQAGETGSVVIGVEISASGSVTAAWVEESSGFSRLDSAALQSAYEWRFHPALDRAGNPVEGKKLVRVVYTLQE